MVAVVDGVASHGWNAVGHLRFDESGRHVAYVGRRGARSFLIVDAWTGPTHDAIGDVSLGDAATEPSAPSPSLRYAYAARDGMQWRVTERGIGPPVDSVRLLVSLPAPEGPMYVARRNGREEVVRGERTVGSHVVVQSLATASDGRWGYVAEDNDSVSVVVDGKTIARGLWAADPFLDCQAVWRS